MATTSTPSDEIISKLTSQPTIWIATVRPDGRPHLAPVWFVYHAEKIYIGTDPKSVKAHNLHANPAISLALEDGTHPVICEGSAAPITTPLPDDLLAAFFQKYEWDLNKEAQYNEVWEVSPRKWLAW